MQVTTKAIVLSSLKYGDTSLIVRAYTLSDGLKTYLLRGIFKARKGKLKTAYFQPLTQLEVVAQHKNKGNLERLLEARVDYHYQSLHSDVIKNAMTLFLAEITYNSIREEEPNPRLFYYLQNALRWLDAHGQIANFHILFVLELTRYLGFYPDNSNDGASFFDLQEGQFVQSPALNPVLSGPMLDYFRRFLGINFDAIHTIGMKKNDRQELLNSLMVYYELHLQGFRKPKSLAVLNEVFR